MDQPRDDPRDDPIAAPTDVPDPPAPTTPTGTSEGARGALRSTPNQHASDDDEAVDTDDARTSHDADDPA